MLAAAGPSGGEADPPVNTGGGDNRDTQAAVTDLSHPRRSPAAGAADPRPAVTPAVTDVSLPRISPTRRAAAEAGTGSPSPAAPPAGRTSLGPHGQPRTRLPRPTPDRQPAKPAAPAAGGLRPLARALLAAAAQVHARRRDAAGLLDPYPGEPPGRGLPSPGDRASMDCPERKGA